MHLKHCVQRNDADGIRVGLEYMLNFHWSNQFPVALLRVSIGQNKQPHYKYTEFRYFSKYFGSISIRLVFYPKFE